MRLRLLHIFEVYLLIPFLNLFKGKKNRMLQQELEFCEDGTLGNSMHLWLKKYDIDLIANFENHDVKHILTGYKSEGIDEVRLQIFMLGNGNYSLICILLASIGLFFPEYWSVFKCDFAKGAMSNSLKEIRLKEHKNRNLEELRLELKIQQLDAILPLEDIVKA